MAAASTRPAPAPGGQGCQIKSDGPAGPDGPPRQSAGVASPGSHRRLAVPGAAGRADISRTGRTRGAVQATHLPFSVVPVSGGVSLCPYHSTAHSLVLFRSLFFSCSFSAAFPVPTTLTYRGRSPPSPMECAACFFFHHLWRTYSLRGCMEMCLLLLSVVDT